jgi:hypothetical protein
MRVLLPLVLVTSKGRIVPVAKAKAEIKISNNIVERMNCLRVKSKTTQINSNPTLPSFLRGASTCRK